VSSRSEILDVRKVDEAFSHSAQRLRRAWNTADMFPGAGRQRTGESMTATT
jgi:hypothetical protein